MNRTAVLVGLVLVLQTTGSYGIEVSTSTNCVGRTLGMDLDALTSFKGEDKISNGYIYEGLEAVGEGDNSIEQRIGGLSHSVTSSLWSQGRLKISHSAVANGYYSAMSQMSQVAGDAVYSSTTAASDENTRHVTAGFDGNGGSMDLSLVAMASSNARINGQVSMLGINALDSTDLSGGMAEATRGLYPTTDGNLGGFGVFSANIPRSPESSASSDIIISNEAHPAQTNSSSSYALECWRWEDNPTLYFYLKNDSEFQAEGLSASDVKAAIGSAAGTWDASTSQVLFSGRVIDYYKDNTVKMDWRNIVSWGPLSSSALAYSHTYYACNWPVIGADLRLYSLALDSDIRINSDYTWTTSDAAMSYPAVPDVFDLETVLLHELGHTYGLADLYTLPGSDMRSQDYAQIMNAYDGKQRNLGAGDISGIQALYGP